MLERAFETLGGIFKNKSSKSAEESFEEKLFIESGVLSSKEVADFKKDLRFEAFLDERFGGGRGFLMDQPIGGVPLELELDSFNHQYVEWLEKNKEKIPKSWRDWDNIYGDLVEAYKKNFRFSKNLRVAVVTYPNIRVVGFATVSQRLDIGEFSEALSWDEFNVNYALSANELAYFLSEKRIEEYFNSGGDAGLMRKVFRYRQRVLGMDEGRVRVSQHIAFKRRSKELYKSRLKEFFTLYVEEEI